ELHGRAVCTSHFWRTTEHLGAGQERKPLSLHPARRRRPLAFVFHLYQLMDAATASTLPAATPASHQSFTMRKSSWIKELRAPVMATLNPIKTPITISEQGRLFILLV